MVGLNPIVPHTVTLYNRTGDMGSPIYCGSVIEGVRISVTESADTKGTVYIMSRYLRCDKPFLDFSLWQELPDDKKSKFWKK